MESKKILKKTIEVIELFDSFNKEHFQDEYNGLNINDVHTIAFIGESEKVRLNDIAVYLNVTRGGASRIAKRLILEDYIIDYKIENNKKEKYFRLTNRGEIVFKKHKEVHKKSIERDSKLFNDFNDDEKNIIFRFLDVLEEDLKDKLKKR
ncbi:MAG: MarR family transcriptional regulator [Clostridium sp.]|uniref:MarR family transcriptional regulator n=1 Tax=Clostridium sp. TaxID=1506 RepID=UPI003EE6AE1A